MIKKTGASSFAAYAEAASLYPMLTPEQEIDLVTRYQTTGCLESRDQIIRAHLRYVMTVARNLAGGREDREDIIQEGCIGMIAALDKFEVERGFRFAMYATHWMKSSMKQYMLDTMRIFRIAVSKPQRKCYYNLHTFKKEGRVFTQREVENIAEALSVTVEDVREMEKKLVGTDLSLNLDPEHNVDLMNSLYDEDCDPALIAEQEDWDNKLPLKMQEAISTLDVRSRHIINDRWFVKDTKSLHELGAIHNVSYERIRQLEIKSMKTIKASLQQFAA